MPGVAEGQQEGSSAGQSEARGKEMDVQVWMQHECQSQDFAAPAEYRTLGGFYREFKAIGRFLAKVNCDLTWVLKKPLWLLCYVDNRL